MPKKKTEGTEAQSASAKKETEVKASESQKTEENSLEILNSMVQEISTSKWPETRVGTITEVRKGPNFDTLKERLFVISVGGGVVYMLEREALDEISKEKKTANIIGKEIKFKPLGVNNGAIFVSSRYCLDMYRKALEEGSVLKGTIYAIKPAYDRHDYEAVINCRGDTVYMRKRDYSIYKDIGYFPALIDTKVSFKVDSIDEEGKVWVSHKALQKNEYDAIIEELKNPEGVPAKITKIQDFGAYLEYKGVGLILRNKDFCLDYTPVSEVKKKGDSLIVRLLMITERTGKIHVEMVHKYVAPQTLTNHYEKNQILKGTVNGLSTFALFVRVAPGVDVMCPYPEIGKEPAKGEEVFVKITKIAEVEKNGIHRTQLRGYIVNQNAPATQQESES